MGKGRACIDIFSLSNLIDVEKQKYLYQPLPTECSKVDPFNDWTLFTEYFYEILADFLDSISNETAELSFEDGVGENTLTDDWVVFVQEVFRDFMDSVSNEYSELSFEDGVGENVLIDDWETIVETISRDFSDTIDNEFVEVEFIDEDGQNTLTDDWSNDFYFDELIDTINNEEYSVEIFDRDVNFDIIDDWVSELILERIRDTISNELYDLSFYDTDGALYYDKDLDISSDFIDNDGINVSDESNDWDINIVDK